MEYYQIKYFTVVARTLSFQLSANELYVTRQAVSKAVSQLEEELGYALFIRAKSGLNLSPHGTLFIKRAYELVEQFERLQGDMQSYRAEGIVEVRFSFAHTTFPLLCDPISRFQQEYADQMDMEVRGVSEQECTRQIQDGDVDFCLSTIPIPEAVSNVVAEYPIKLLMSREHPLAAKPTITLADLQNQTFIAYRSGTDTPLYIPEFIQTMPSCRCLKSDDLLYIFRCVRDKAYLLMSVEENVGNMIEGTIHRTFPGAGSWKWYLSISRKAAGNPKKRKLYEELNRFLLNNMQQEVARG